MSTTGMWVVFELRPGKRLNDASSEANRVDYLR